MRMIDAHTVAKALVSIFARFKLPHEILTDQGVKFLGSTDRGITQFTL